MAGARLLIVQSVLETISYPCKREIAGKFSSNFGLTCNLV